PQSLMPAPVYNWQATIGWPTNNARYQVHVAGQASADLSGGGVLANVVLYATTSEPDPNNVRTSKGCSANVTCQSLVMLAAGDPTSNPIRFQFIRSIAWNDPAYLYDNAPATVGQSITDPASFHDSS